MEPRLWLVILKCFWWRILLQGFLSFLEVSIHVCMHALRCIVTSFVIPGRGGKEGREEGGKEGREGRKEGGEFQVRSVID